MWIKLIRRNEDTPTYVNFAGAAFFEEYRGGTTIAFGEGTSVDVVETPEQVLELIRIEKEKA